MIMNAMSFKKEGGERESQINIVSVCMTSILHCSRQPLTVGAAAIATQFFTLTFADISVHTRRRCYGRHEYVHIMESDDGDDHYNLDAK